MKFLALLLLASCATIQSSGQAVVDCAEAEAPQAITDQVSTALTGTDDTWQAQLDKLLTDAGGIVVCAVEKEVSTLEHSSMHNGATQVAYVRGRMWLSSENHLAMVKH